MKKFIVLIISMSLISCAGMELTDTTSGNMTGYITGRAMGAVVLETDQLGESVDEDLSAVWVSFMARNQGKKLVESDEMLSLYNECIGVVALHTDDPYGVVQDLGALMLLFGAQYADENREKLLSVEPVPYSVLKWFELGYENSRRSYELRKAD
jgi:hypothetical protein